MNMLRNFLIISTVISCGGCASSPVVGYHRAFHDETIVVTSEFQFTTGPSAASKMDHTWTIPAGTYHASGVDNNGTYYQAPGSGIRIKARLADRLSGGLYRSGDRYFIYSQGTTEMAALLAGNKPYIWDEVPHEFTKFIEHR